MNYPYLILAALILYIVMCLICDDKSNCHFSLFQFGDIHQSNEKKNDEES